MNLRRFYLKESIQHLMNNQGSCEIPLIDKRLITAWLEHMYPMEGALMVSHDSGVTYDLTHGYSFDRDSAKRNSCIKEIVYRNMNYRVTTKYHYFKELAKSLPKFVRFSAWDVIHKKEDFDALDLMVKRLFTPSERKHGAYNTSTASADAVE